MADNENKIVLQGSKTELMQRIPVIMDLFDLLEGKNVGAFYTTPVTTFQDTYEFYPQVKLMFYQTYSEANGKPRATGEISFRLMNETEKTYNEAKARVLAERIKTKFATGQLFTWHKGKITVSYIDKKRGYKFRLLVTHEGEGRKIIENVLDIQNHSPEWSNLRVSESRAEYPDIPPREVIYGELRRLPRRRPVELMRFRYAELHVWGVPHAISLVDVTRRRATPLVSVA